MAFSLPTVWREPKDHITDCYFYMIKTVGFSSKNKNKIQYPDVPSAIRTVPNVDNSPIPVPPTDNAVESDKS